MDDPVMMWLIVGAGLIVFEAVTAPGLGIFLAGLGALTTALIIQAGIVEPAHTAAQFAWFFGLTTAWTAGLWKPFQKFRSKQKNSNGGHGFHDMVGSIAVVGKGGLKRGEVGQALWSGTTMSAMLDNHATEDFLPEGTHTKISSVSGNIVYLIPNRS